MAEAHKDRAAMEAQVTALEVRCEAYAAQVARLQARLDWPRES